MRCLSLDAQQDSQPERSWVLARVLMDTVTVSIAPASGLLVARSVHVNNLTLAAEIDAGHGALQQFAARRWAERVA